MVSDGSVLRAVVFACGGMGAGGIRSLLEAAFEVTLVFTGDDTGSAQVKDLCKDLGIPCVTPRDPNQFGWIERVRQARPDMLFNFAHPAAPRAQVLAIPAHGSFRLHASLLPAYRGPDPVRRAIMAGERTTGVTLHELVVEPYAGAVVACRPVEISPADTPLSLTEKIDRAAGEMLAEVLPRMKSHEFALSPQDLTSGSTHAAVTPEDGSIAWDRPADEIRNLIRAFGRPFSGAYGFLGDEMVLLWQAAVEPGHMLEPGSVSIRKDDVLVGTGYGCIRPLEIEVCGRVLRGPRVVNFFTARSKDAFQ